MLRHMYRLKVKPDNDKKQKYNTTRWKDQMPTNSSVINQENIII